MLIWALIFLLAAVFAGILGFVGTYIAAALAGRIIFFVFITLFAVTIVLWIVKRHKGGQ